VRAKVLPLEHPEIPLIAQAHVPAGVFLPMQCEEYQDFATFKNIP
jgi:hypothetical protein